MESTKTKNSQGWEFKFAKVIEVLDGDTVRLFIDQGYGNFTRQDIRIRGINTPETDGVERLQGLSAKAFVQQLLPVGAPVRLVSYQTKSGKDKRSFTRYIGDVYFTDATGVSINLAEYLIKEGVAKPYMV